MVIHSTRLTVALIFIISTFILITPAFAIGAPEISVYGEPNSTPIVNGDDTPSTDDSTDFGNVGTDATTNAYYEICNQGNANLNLLGTPPVELAGDTDFSVAIQPASVIGTSHCTNFQIAFSPGSLGAKTATVSIANNDADENPYTFVIAGNGVTPAPEIEVHYDKVQPIADGDNVPSTDNGTDFSDVGIDSTLSHWYFIDNNGETDLNLSGAPLVELTGDADFSVTVDPDSVIPSSKSTYFEITFAPATLGAKTATVSIASNDADENPYTFVIAGNGTPPAPEMDVHYEKDQPIVDGDTVPSIDNGTDFSDVAISAISNRYYDICNNGNSNLNLSGTPRVELTGDADFSVSIQPASVISASDCSSFEIVFAPTTLGTKTATVSIASNDADENPYTFAVAGSGVPPAPEMDIHESWTWISIADGDTTPWGPDGTDFGNVVIGSRPGVVDYYICNDGNADLHLTGTSLVDLTGDADFSVTNTPYSGVISTLTCDLFEITFAPTEAGIKTAMVSIANDDSDENPYNFVIKGQGVGPDSYESDDDFASANPISAGAFQEHNIVPVGDNDYMRFTLEQESGVVLTLSGPDDKSDTFLDLYDNDQTLVASDDDGGDSLYSRITRTCGLNALPAGAYYIKVTDYNNDEVIPSYTVSLAKTACAKTVTFKSVGSQDGWVLESAETSGQGGSFNPVTTSFNLGDDATKKQYRGILSFNTGAKLPDNAVITKVVLKVRKQGVVGSGNPVNIFNGFMVDIKKGIFGTAVLQNTDFQAAASKTYGPFKPALASGWYSINLTSGKAYINKLATNSGLTQMRLRFKLDDNNDTLANYLKLYSGNAPATSRPQLVITYYVP